MRKNDLVASLALKKERILGGKLGIIQKFTKKFLKILRLNRKLRKKNGNF
jgi:hypothetical protein